MGDRYVDKDRRLSISSHKVTFEHIDIESQPVAFELGRFQDDDGVGYR